MSGVEVLHATQERIGPFRPLRRLIGFRELVGNQPQPKWFHSLPLNETERVVGIYENSPEKREKSIVFSDQAMHLDASGSWLTIRYEDIEDAHSPPTDDPDWKVRAQTVELRLRDGGVYEIPVSRRKGRFPDVWPFLTFLKNVDRVVRWHNRQSVA